VNTVSATQAIDIYVNQNAAYSPYIGNEVLPTGNNPFMISDLPLQYPATLHSENYMVSVKA
jgi:hypothetical protein